MTKHSMSMYRSMGDMFAAMQAEIDAKEVEIARLREAALTVLTSWDKRMPDGPEQLRTLDSHPPHEYWSPSASMVASSAMAALRAALKEAEDGSL